MNTKEKIQKRTIASNASLLDAMKKMDASCVKTLLVFESNAFLGMLTIGDIQRNIIKNTPLNSCIKNILSNDKIYASPEDSVESIKKQMEYLRAECMPVVDKNGGFINAYFWSDFFKSEKVIAKETIDIPVVIMAGGKGTRLKPITNVIPKPLIPIGDKTILEEIMDQFENIGCKQFYMSVNYKSDMMRFYLDQLEHKYNIDFFEETKPLGTIGSVSLLKGKINTPFFVSNCDIMIDQDYRDVYDYHKQNKNDLTIVTAVKSIRIPYGVIDTGDDGLMTGLREKPEITYMINTGVYLLNSGLIEEIPEGEFFHITHLMEKVKAWGGRVGCFPVSEGSWRDMGEWPEYLKMIKVL
jgi:dTDP-glucose pyrophosphorylase